MTLQVTGSFDSTINILFVGNDPAALDLVTLSARLRQPDALIATATTATAGLQIVERDSPHLVVMYPDFADLTLIQAVQELRRLSNTLLIVIGHPEDKTQLIGSMVAGADDFVYVDCRSTELMVRLWARLRRSSTPSLAQAEASYRVGELLVHPDRYEAFLGDQKLELTGKEFQLLHALASNAGAILLHQRLLNIGWKCDERDVTIVKKYIQRLRQKLGDDAQNPQWIATVHGVGYRFIRPATA